MAATQAMKPILANRGSRLCKGSVPVWQRPNERRIASDRDSAEGCGYRPCRWSRVYLGQGRRHTEATYAKRCRRRPTLRAL